MTKKADKPRSDDGRFISPDDVPCYEITVWDMAEGDVVKVVREATEKDRREIEEWYGDKPGIEIQIEDWP